MKRLLVVQRKKKAKKSEARRKKRNEENTKEKKTTTSNPVPRRPLSNRIRSERFVAEERARASRFLGWREETEETEETEVVSEDPFSRDVAIPPDQTRITLRATPYDLRRFNPYDTRVARLAANGTELLDRCPVSQHPSPSSCFSSFASPCASRENQPGIENWSSVTRILESDARLAERGGENRAGCTPGTSPGKNDVRLQFRRDGTTRVTSKRTEIRV